MNDSFEETITFPPFKIRPGYVNPGLTEPYRTIYVTLCCIIMIASLIGNVVLLTIVLTRRKLRTTANLLLLSLVGADLLTSVLFIPIYTERFFHQSADHSNVVICLLRKYLYIATSSGSLLSLGAISFDRMLVISYPYRYESWVTKKRVVFVILTIWVWTIAFNSVAFHPFLNWGRILSTCIAGIPSVLFFLVTPVGFYVPGFVIVGSYMKIYLVARRVNKKVVNHSKLSTTYNEIFLNTLPVQSTPITNTTPQKIQIRRSSSLPTLMSIAAARTDCSSTSLSSAVNRLPTTLSMVGIDELSQPPPPTTKPRSATLLSQTIGHGKKHIRKVKKSIKRDLRTVKTISMLVGLFLLCWLPTAGFNLYINVKGLATNNDRDFLRYYEIFTLVSFVNCAIDPYLYTFRNTELRKETRKTFSRLYKCIIKSEI